MKLKTKTKKVPAWFIKDYKKVEGLKAECGKILGVGTHWLDVKKNQQLALNEYANMFDLSVEELLTFKYLSKKRDAIASLMWAKYRLSNVKNDWGKATSLFYDEKKHIMQIRLSVTEYLKQHLSKALQDYGKIQPKS